MVGCTISGYGLGIVVDFTCDDSNDFCTWYVVYSGGWFIIFVWCNLLFMAQIKIRPCIVAFMCHWGQCVFFLCGALWFDYRFCAKVYALIKPPYWRFFNQMDFLLFCIQSQLVNVPNVMPLQSHVVNTVCMIPEYPKPHQH